MPRRCSNGMSLVEAVIAVAILMIIVSGVISTYPLFLRTGLSNLNYAQGALLLEEGVEAVKILRDSGWMTHIATLTPNATYRLAFASSTWQATTIPIIIAGRFDRTFKLASVSRDANDNIAPSGTLDPKTRQLTVSVAWAGTGGTTTREIATYITDLFNN